MCTFLRTLYSKDKQRKEYTSVRRPNLSIIDRFYVLVHFVDRGGFINIVVGTTFSDHAEIVLVLELKVTLDSILMDGKYVNQVIHMRTISFHDALYVSHVFGG